ncbi:MAG: hypothetical protein D6798_11390 [Deltaproteobacteria bacterium]|nr:MAG: hypothetical protein D6798_11390 [Deltaproteobacteria bacterium]
MVSRLLPSLLVVAGCVTQPAPLDMCVEVADEPAKARRPPPSGLMYEVYVRSWQDSDGDGIGDLAGVVEHLDHLEAIGVRTLWLMPVFPSPSRAGYDPVALDSVRPDYGDEADLLALFDAAAARGIDVILDAPVNHVSDQHPWFQAVVEDPDALEADAFLVSDRQWDELRWYPLAEDRWYYAYFGEEMPDLDWTSPLVADSVPADLGQWLDQGAGGYRFDAVRQLVEDDGAIADTEVGHCTLAWLYARLGGRRGLVFSEAWSEDLDEVLPYLGTEDRPEADLLLGMPRRRAIADAFQQADRAPLVVELLAEADAGVLERMATPLGSHDLPRLADMVPEAALRRAWMVLQLTLPGVPVLYYGDEIDLYSTDVDQQQDQPWRAPMPWTADAWGGFSTSTPWMALADGYAEGFNVADQWQDPWSMLSLVGALARLREAVDALDHGALIVHDTHDRAVLAFERRADDADDAVMVLVNLGDRAIDEVAVPTLERVAWFDLTDGGVERDLGTGAVGLPPLGYRVLSAAPLPDLAVPGPVPR